jgi:hypothetical protein
LEIIMGHEDVFCPECGDNIGPGLLELIGCPCCGYEGDIIDNNVDDDEPDES